MALRKRSVGLRRPSPAKRGGSKSAAPASVEPLKRWLAEKGIRKAKVGGVDVDGVWRGKYISLDKLLSAAVGGLGFCDVVFGWDIADDLYDNSKVTGWHTGYPDAQARIDTSTARVIPWEPDVAAFLLDFVNADASRKELRQLESAHPGNVRLFLAAQLLEFGARPLHPRWVRRVWNRDRRDAHRDRSRRLRDR